MNTNPTMHTTVLIGPAASSMSGSAVKAKQLKQLHHKLARLSANLANTENLLRMTSVQAEAMQGLGTWHASLFMAASKVLGEESLKEQESQAG